MNSSELEVLVQHFYTITVYKKHTVKIICFIKYFFLGGRLPPVVSSAGRVIQDPDRSAGVLIPPPLLPHLGRDEARGRGGGRGPVRLPVRPPVRPPRRTNGPGQEAVPDGRGAP